MNINQAKALAGLPRNARVNGRGGAERALKALKPLIVQARRVGDDSLAAELSQAKEVFRKRLVRHNCCEVCGKPISASATRCRACLRPQALPLPAGFVVPQTRLGKRVDVSPSGGWLARYGLYAPSVQKVVRKWRRIPQPTLERYFAAVAGAVIHGNLSRLQTVRHVPALHWPVFFELGGAVAELVNDRKDLMSWLIRYPLQVGTNGRQQEWEEIARSMAAHGAKGISVAALKKAASKMKLTTPKVAQAAYRKAFKA